MYIKLCNVCGWSPEIYDPDPPLYDVGDFCDCCGCEFGIEDRTLAQVRSVRNHWLKNGAKWFTPEDKPENWNLEEQLAQIPEEWR